MRAAKPGQGEPDRDGAGDEAAGAAPRRRGRGRKPASPPDAGRPASEPTEQTRAAGLPAGSAPREGGRAGQPEGAAAEGFYAELFTPDELDDLARTEGEPSLEDEIALLRVAIRRGVAQGESLETVSRSVQRLAQALKVQRALQGQGIRNLEEALARVLEEIGSELGAAG